MSFKVINQNDPGSSIQFGGDDLDKITSILNGSNLSAIIVINNEWKFKSGKLALYDSDATHKIVVNTSLEAADRTLTVPVLGGNRTLALVDIAQTFSALPSVFITATGTYETVFKGSTSTASANDFISIANGVTLASAFTTVITAQATSTNITNAHTPLTLQSIVSAGDDTSATTPLISLLGKRDSNAAIVNRPLVSITNYTTKLLDVYPTYVDFNSALTIRNSTITVDQNTVKHSSTNTAGDILVNNGTSFTRLARGSSGQFLAVKSDETTLEWKTTGAGITNMADLEDVALDSPSTGEILMYDTDHWVNSSAGAPTALSGMSDVSITDPDTGHMLQYSAGGRWTNVASPVFTSFNTGSGIISLPVSLTDTVLTFTNTATLSGKTIGIDTNTIAHSTTNAAGDLMKYSVASGKYVRMAMGTSGQVLQSTGSDIGWATLGQQPGGSSAGSDYLYNVYIDTGDSNKFKAFNLETNVVDYTSAASTDASVVLNSVLAACHTNKKPFKMSKGDFVCTAALDTDGIYIGCYGTRFGGYSGGVGDPTRETVIRKNFVSNDPFITWDCSVDYNKAQWNTVVIEGRYTVGGDPHLDTDVGVYLKGHTTTGLGEVFDAFKDVMICHFDVGLKVERGWWINFYGLAVYNCVTAIHLTWSGSGKKCNCLYFYGGETRNNVTNVWAEAVDDAGLYSMGLEGHDVVGTQVNSVKIGSASCNVKVVGCSFESLDSAVDIITDAGFGNNFVYNRFGGVYGAATQTVYHATGNATHSNFSNNIFEPYDANGKAEIKLDAGVSYLNITFNHCIPIDTGIDIIVTNNATNAGSIRIWGNNGAGSKVQDVFYQPALKYPADGTITFGGAGLASTLSLLSTGIESNVQNRIYTTAATGYESVFRASISTAYTTDYFSIDNGTNQTNRFTTIIRAITAETTGGENALNFQGGVADATDLVASAPIVAFSGKRATTDYKLVNRALFAFNNYLTAVVKIWPGYLDTTACGQRVKVVSKSSTYTATAADYILLVSGATTINLPAAASSSGQVYIIKKTDASNSVTIDGNASETIDGATTKTISTQYQTLEIACNGSAWYITGHFA